MKRFHDWYKLQKSFQQWDLIQADFDVIDIVQNKGWNLDLKYCHSSLKQSLELINCEKSQSDFFVITELELGKLPLELFFRLVKSKYESSKIGGYVAVLSYYLNTKKSYDDLDGNYSQNIDKVFRKNFEYVKNLQCVSQVLDNPIDHLVNGQLLEGSNFIFVHPNVRYFLWK